MLTIAGAPGRGWPLPRSASCAHIEAAFPAWQTIAEDTIPVSALPGPLKNADPRFYLVRRR